MNDAGFDNYTASDGGYSTSDDGNGEAELLANYTCSLRYVMDPAETDQLNEAEMDYWYEYFKEELVPCLANHDLSVSEVPTRAQFHEGHGWWNPYWTLPEKDQQFAFNDERLHRECPIYPRGVPDPWLESDSSG